MRTLVALTACVLLFLAPLRARASPSYPAQIVSDLMITCQPAVPQCTVCHATTSGGGKPVTPFGIAMVGAGLVPNDPAALSAALTSLQNSSDKTQQGYIKDLQACTDPNAGTTQVGYGIYCNASGSEGSGPFLVVIAMALGIAIGRRRRAA